MKSENILSRILNCKGQYISLNIKSNPKPAASYKDVRLEKHTSSKFRAGIEFQNLKSVKDAIENKERGEVQPLPWGQWKKYPYIIEHKDKEYIRLYPAVNSTSGAEVKYIVNGKEVDKSTFNTYLKPSDVAKQGTTMECFVVAIENIFEVEEQADKIL